MRRALIPDYHTARALRLALRFPRDQQAHLTRQAVNFALLSRDDLVQLVHKPGEMGDMLFQMLHAAGHSRAPGACQAKATGQVVRVATVRGIG